MAANCVLWFVVADLLWSFRGFWVGVDSPQGIADTRFALGEFTSAGVNALAFTVWLAARSSSWSSWLGLAVLAGNAAFGTFEAVTRNMWWLVVVAAAALAAAMVYLSRPETRRPSAGPPG